MYLLTRLHRENNSPAPYTNPPFPRMPGIIYHIVHFEYKQNILNSDRQLIASKFLALLDTCSLHGKRYILSATGGVNNSPEGQNKGLDVRWIDRIFHTVAH